MATCDWANDVPLETVANRSVPMAYRDRTWTALGCRTNPAIRIRPAPQRGYPICQSRDGGMHLVDLLDGSEGQPAASRFRRNSGFSCMLRRSSSASQRSTITTSFSPRAQTRATRRDYSRGPPAATPNRRRRAGHRDHLPIETLQAQTWILLRVPSVAYRMPAVLGGASAA
jgi:hypothetical protein